MRKPAKKERDFYLVQRALCGDQTAYTEIYNRYQPVLAFQLSKIIKDKDLLADMILESFEKAFERFQRFQPDYQLSAWLVKIGTNCALDYLRKKNRVVIVSIDESFNDTDDDRPTLQIKDDSRNPEEAASFRQRLKFLEGLMKKLPEMSEQVIRLRYLEGFSCEEIADEMGLPITTTKAALHRARKDLSALAELFASNEMSRE